MGADVVFAGRLTGGGGRCLLSLEALSVADNSMLWAGMRTFDCR